MSPQMGSLAVHFAAAGHMTDVLFLLVVSTCVPGKQQEYRVTGFHAKPT